MPERKVYHKTTLIRIKYFITQKLFVYLLCCNNNKFFNIRFLSDGKLPIHVLKNSKMLDALSTLPYNVSIKL